MAKPKALPTPRIEVFPGANKRYYFRLVKRGGKVTEGGRGGREGGYGRRGSAQRQAMIDHPLIPIVNIFDDGKPPAKMRSL